MTLVLLMVVISVSKFDDAVCNPSVLAIVKSPSLTVGCKAFNAPCNPSVLAMVKSPSLIVGC
jgi:hypothetical protein